MAISPGRMPPQLGRMTPEKLVQAEIVSGTRTSKDYNQMTLGMKFPTLKKMSELAIEYDNIPALRGIAKSNQYAVAEALQSKEGVRMIERRAARGEGSAPELFFMLRSNFDPQYRKIYRRLARISVLKSSYRVVGRGLKGELQIRTEYEPGMSDFDMDLLIEKFLINRYIQYSDIVAIERRSRENIGVLMFDTSGSLYGEKFRNAAMAVAILAYHLAREKYAVILFNTKATVIKQMNEKVKIDTLIDRVLESDSAGYTNISDALKSGLKELNKDKRTEKFGVLISDGCFNRGQDPRPFAKNFFNLHVLSLPSEKVWGEAVCRDLSRLGKGRYIAVKSVNQIPRILMKLLRKKS
ncbi:MAG: VWA domain-containing protein [Candidatus Heimdallarchaeota archaeon]|nr:VWA domain-containing protein [Candidatus Heimdallarchaeota archaeon]MBY8994268.1 VWA domain-containing protein [Candidatus Heimdallarchaeota archaeon]